MNVNIIANGLEMVLTGILGNEDWKKDPHLHETPLRAAKGFAEIFEGYTQDPTEFFKAFDDENSCDQMVIVGPIKEYSTCAHHMLPFSMEIYTGYIPDGKIAGISKFVRMSRVIAKKLQVQERITEEIADIIEETLHPKGTMVLVKNSEHMCMKMRGVKSPCANVTTSAVRGVFSTDEKARQEFLGLIK